MYSLTCVSERMEVNLIWVGAKSYWEWEESMGNKKFVTSINGHDNDDESVFPSNDQRTDLVIN